MSGSGQSVLFRCDASPEIGGGHVMRCLTLAGALAGMGASITFATTAQTLETVPQLAASGYELVLLDNREDIAIGAPDGDRQHDWVIIDHYGLGIAAERGMRAYAACVGVFDDAPNRDHDCDLLIDQNFGAHAEAYQARVPSHCTILAGSRFALLRSEFARARKAALERPSQEHGVLHILVSMGMTDLGGVTGDVVDAILTIRDNVAIDVVVARTAPSYPRLEALSRDHSRIQLHSDVKDMAGLMSRADLGVGAAGSTSWERCCLGLPAILVVLAENQRVIAEALASARAVLVADGVAQVGGLIERCLEAPDNLRAMRQAALQIIDGEGAGRVATVLTAGGPVAMEARPRTETAG